jgi:hypothetical protein
MNNNNKIVYGAIAITFIVAVLALFVGIGAKAVPSTGTITTNLPSMGLADLAVGSGCDQSYTSCTGTDLTHILATTGSVLSANTTQSASTTAPYDIAVTNALTTDNVLAQFASTTMNSIANVSAASFPTGWWITSAHASSTAGFVTVMVYNGTGRTASLAASAGIASSTNVILIK